MVRCKICRTEVVEATGNNFNLYKEMLDESRRLRKEGYTGHLPDFWCPTCKQFRCNPIPCSSCNKIYGEELINWEKTEHIRCVCNSREEVKHCSIKCVFKNR